MKPFTMLAVVVFAIVSALQLLRVLMGWDVVVGGFTIPAWGSLIAAVVAALLAVMLWRENRATR